MLQLVGFIYGLFALITGKFHMSKTKKAVGPQARIAGLVLVLEPLAAFSLASALALAGVQITTMIGFGIELTLLVAAFFVAFRIAGKAANAQQAQAFQGQPAQQPSIAKAA